MGNCALNRILFVNFLPSVTSSYADRGSAYPSTATLLLATLLHNQGYDVTLIDGGYYGDYLKQIEKYIETYAEDVLFVGMSVMTTQVPFALEVSERVKKKCSTVPVVWGGPHATLFPDQILSNGSIDLAVINEGAETAIQLARALRDNLPVKTVNGIAYKGIDGRCELTPPAGLDSFDAMPHIDFSLFDVENYLGGKYSVYQREFPYFTDKIRIMPIVTGLGCPFRCRFCINVILKRRYRFREAHDIVNEIKRLQERYGANTFLFLDEDFFINKRRVFEFIDLVEREKLKFNWRMWCRVDHFKSGYIDDSLLDRLENIGFGSMVMGGESGNSEILSRLNKGTTLTQIENSLRALRGRRITPRYSFIIGLEDETMQQIMDTYNFCFKLKKMHPEVDIAGPFIFRLYPGSKIYNSLIKRYDIYTPKKLEEWEDFLSNEETFTQMPWVPRKFSNALRFLDFYNFHAMKKSVPIKGVRDILKNILRISARLRVKHFKFFLPIEFWMVRRFNK